MSSHVIISAAISDQSRGVGLTAMADEKGPLELANELTTKFFLSKQRIPLQSLCVHPANRGGVYPNGPRVANLINDVLLAGVVKSEADHLGVCVMEYSEASRRTGYITFEQFNKSNCKKSTLFQKCFTGATDTCQYGCLAHNHLLLGLKCILNQAGFKWPTKYATSFNRSGGVDFEHIKKSWPDLHELLTTGIEMIILKPEVMDEPGACSLISQALNKNQALGGETAETTALASLATAISGKLDSDGRDEITFPKMKEALRHELDAFVDEQHFIDLYQYVLNLGSLKSPHLTKLVEFFQTFVDSKHRRLQLSAFAEINKLPEKTPRVHVAVLMLSYRREPPKGSMWCHMPDPIWGRKASGKEGGIPDIRDLESLLRYVDVDIMPQIEKVADIQDSKKIVFRCDCYIAAAGGLVNFNGKKDKNTLREALLKAVAPMFEEARTLTRRDLPTPSGDASDWIDTTIMPTPKKEDDGDGKKKKADAPLLPKVVSFDQWGDARDEQDFNVRASKSDVICEIPISPWYQMNSTKRLCVDRVRKAAVEMALAALHEHMATVEMPIVCMSKNKVLEMKVTRNVAKGDLLFPACAPVDPKFSDKQNQNNDLVEIKIVKHIRNENVQEQLPDPEKSSLWLAPEKKLPVLSADGTFWSSFTGKESMGPAWLVPRMSLDDLNKYNFGRQHQRLADFNVDWRERTFHIISAGSLADQNLGCTFDVIVPILTNIVDLKEDDVLIMQAPVKKKTDKKIPKEDWRVQHSRAEKRRHQDDGASSAAKKTNIA